MKIIILGAAAGGGLPQWNCGCNNCDDARSPDNALLPQTQSSIAVSADDSHWTIINASPDIRQQLAVTPALHPKELRHSPISSVIVTNGDIDHIAGLLTLREKQPFSVMATSEIHKLLADNSVFNVLSNDNVKRNSIRLNEPFTPSPDLKATLFSVPGKVPLFMEEKDAPIDTEMMGEQTVGVLLEANGKQAYYIPGCAALPDNLKGRISQSDLLLFDGTVFNDNEMQDSGAGHKTGRRMGHMPIAGNDGSMNALKDIEIGSKVFVHINNTNPIWQPNAPERKQVEQEGWVVGYDGMEIRLG
ncbi:MAG: pyrroloquinoline quinone biosynthesis protein PqqB [Rickettsiales bacterium]|nr:pyrroloquinoline quinone biosynthesis protein PqqB [Rickettsiales bacterium]